jgi:archaellum biogenesis ATPase FlaH
MREWCFSWRMWHQTFKMQLAEKMKNINENVIPMDAWKQALHLKREEKSLLDYLNVLSFHDLMNESKEIVMELEAESYNDDLALRARMIIEEISGRLSHYSGEVTLMLNGMLKNLEEKIQGIR